MGGVRRVADYGFLSDCQTSALVGRDGSVDWLGFPRFDSSSFFGRLLDPQAGHWRICPHGEFETERRYLGETLVLESVFSTGEGKVRLVDCLAFEPGARGHDIGIRSPHVLLRSVQGLSGCVEMEFEYAPRFEYGLTHPRLKQIPGGLRCAGGPTQLDLFGPLDLEWDAGTARARFTMDADDRVGFSLRYAPAFPEEEGIRVGMDVASGIADTRAGWESWSDMHEGYDGLHRDLVKHSSLVLQGLTYQPSGAVVAAATTSLPELVGGDANYDYRFAWLRDLSLMMRALWVAACPHEPERMFHWIDRSGGRMGHQDVQIMYGVEGERRLIEDDLDHMEGFRGSRPVRVGNAAWRQSQLDVLGEVLDAAHQLRDALGEFDRETRALLVGLADRAARSWDDDDAGMWESRDQQRPYLSSKVMCWVALDRAIRLADRLDAGDRVQAWRRARDEVHRAVQERGWSEDAGAYTGAFGSTHLDASVLLMPLVGFLPATDERMRRTIEAVERELGEGGLVRRWQGEENGFIISSYWLVECLMLAGEEERARERFETITRHANDLGLLAEMAQPGGELVGNFPQAFSHVGLISAAWRLTDPEGEP